MIILLTGAIGFIGARVARLLLDEGHQIIAVDDMNASYDIHLKEWRLNQLQALKGFDFYKLDINDTERLLKIMGKYDNVPDAVINLAARAGVRASVEVPKEFYHANVDGTLSLLEICRAKGIGKFILGSTSSLYGAVNQLPFKEDGRTDAPLSPYTASKKAAEVLCYTYHHLYNLDVTIFRYFTVYGPAGRPDMSPLRFVQWIIEGRPVLVYGDGTQSRDYTYIDDIARGTIAGLKCTGYEIINLGATSRIVLNDFIALIEELVERKAIITYQPLLNTDMSHTWANIDYAKQLLGWEPTVDIRDGMQRLVEWYLENRDWAKKLDTRS